MTITNWISCGLISSLLFVIFGRNLFRDMDFGDCVWSAIILTLFVFLGPLGLWVMIFASLIYFLGVIFRD